MKASRSMIDIDSIIKKLQPNQCAMLVYTVSATIAVIPLIHFSICDPLSENLTCLHLSRNLFCNFFCYLQEKCNGLLKFQPYVVSSVGVIATGSKKSKTIDLYITYLEIYYKVLI